MELWDVLDENGLPTGETVVREKGLKLKEGQYHRVVHIWIINDKKEYLIQKRALTVELMPGMWAITGGSVVSGEDSKTAALREVEEEIGVILKEEKLKKIATIKRKDNFADVWFVEGNINLKDLKLLKIEVDDAAWADRSTIEGMVANGTFHNYGEEYFKLIFTHGKE
jgi:Isopentenyldiphosphate isomerase